MLLQFQNHSACFPRSWLLIKHRVNYSCLGVCTSSHVCSQCPRWEPPVGLAGQRGISPCLPLGGDPVLTLGFAAYWLPPSKAYGTFWACWHLPHSLPLGSIFEKCKDILFTLPCLYRLTRSLSIFLSQCPLLVARPVCAHCCSSRVLTVPASCLRGSHSTISLF